MLTTVAVSGYRSLRDVVVPLHGLDLVTGANGSGKSSLYRSLRLLAGCGRGDVIGTLAREGGLQSALWAGPVSLDGARKQGHVVQGTVRKAPISLRLGFATEELGYLVDLGLPVQGPASDNSGSAFLRDPEIKREIVWAGPVMRPNSVLVRRRWGVVEVRGDMATQSARSGWDDDWATDRAPGWESDPEPEPDEPAPGRTRGWTQLTTSLRPWQSMLTELADPERAPELLRMRRLISGWRFYDGFRADAAAPARQVQVGTRTPVLSDDGSDLAAALQTIREDGRSGLDAAIADAFQGATLDVPAVDGRFGVHLHQPGMLRPLDAAELSDGTLRYLCLVAALLTVDPPPLMVLNEPETSLHPDLLPPLARLIRAASERSQIMVVSHSEALARELGAGAGTDWDDDAADDDEPAGLGSRPRRVTLVKDLGETFVEGQGLLTTPPWNWGSRR
ncbi:AAA family ATPase [Knoellia subterranea]|uniref:ATP-binding protein n=1 Tax=Knoellia subterranea KCTC 19937 TaxID=1385521 RepID=A0A0A0JLW2_9MICO|nr:AAA family ATPase [Knoellia subterranea]KGN37759.1 ATP-binding protein [Knoellia subterranea KCTC 19937]